MKNKNRYSLLILGIAFFMLAGCNKFLDIAPDERMTINRLDKAGQLVVGAYENTRGYRFLELCDDNQTLVSGVFDEPEIVTDLYTWSRDVRVQIHQDSPSEFWRTSYHSIAAVNQAIYSLDNDIAIGEKDQQQAEVVRGEALIIRSYYHFMLVNIFARHYDPVSAATDLGVPYVTEPEEKLIVHYERNSVEEVYQMAEKDLMEGISLLERNKTIYKPNKYHFTFPTIYLYAARLYTFRNKDADDLSKAISYAEKSIESFGGINVMRKWSEYETDNYGPVDIDQAEVGLIHGSYSWIAYPYNFIYRMTKDIVKQKLSNPFGFTDSRLRIYYVGSGDVFSPALFYYIEGGGKTYTDIFPLAEALLLAAEGHARNNDIAKALGYIRVLSSKVYSNYNSTAVTINAMKAKYGIAKTDKDAIIEHILFERRVQFLTKGMRWFDIKRYGMDVEHKLRDGSLIKLSKVAPNKDMQIPRYAIATGMNPNP